MLRHFLCLLAGAAAAAAFLHAACVAFSRLPLARRYAGEAQWLWRLFTALVAKRCPLFFR